MLKPSGTGCELNYTVHSTGKIARLGQRLIDGAAKSLAEDFFRRFEEELQRRYPAAAGEVVALPAPTASAGLSVWVWGIIAVLVAAAVHLATRG